MKNSLETIVRVGKFLTIGLVLFSSNLGGCLSAALAYAETIDQVEIIGSINQIEDIEEANQIEDIEEANQIEDINDVNQIDNIEEINRTESVAEATQFKDATPPQSPPASYTPSVIDASCPAAESGIIKVSAADELKSCLTSPGTGQTIELQSSITIEAETSYPRVSIEFGTGDYVIDLNGNDIIFDIYDRITRSDSYTLFFVNDTNTNLTFKNDSGQPSAIRSNRTDLTTSTYNGVFGLIMDTSDDQKNTLTIDHVDFKYLHASNSSPSMSISEPAAAISVAGSLENEPIVNISNSTFFHNNGKNAGGAISISSANLKISDSIFEENASEQSGAAINLSGNRLTANITADITNSQFINNASNKGNRTNGGAISAVNVLDFAAEGNTFKQNESIGYGGAIYFSGCNNVNIQNNNLFEQNTSKKQGGAAYIANVQDFDFDNNIIQNNSIDSTNATASGGGLYISEVNNTSLLNNQIIGNHALDGGGIYYSVSGRGGLSPYELTLEGNKINSNIAAKSEISDCRAEAIKNGEGCGYGGGLVLALGNTTINDDETTNTTPVILNINSGEFIGNQAADGGGIYFGIGWFYPEGTLNLYNALITNNIATRGGGIWLCPKAEVEMYSTDGSVIVDNTATGNLTYPWASGNQPFDSEGDDIFYVGTDDPTLADPQYSTSAPRTRLYVSSRSWSGLPIDWYKDELNDRYSPLTSQLLLPTSPYLIGTGTGTKDLAALHGNYDYLAEAEKTASLVIKDNVAARRGGGIFSNNVMAFGKANADVELSVKKKFVNGTGEEKSEGLPDSLNVDLYRINSNDGSEEKIDSATLSAQNDWSHTFEELPSESFYGGNFAYRVVEESLDDWKLRDAVSTNPYNNDNTTCSYNNDPVIQQLSCSITLINSLGEPEEPEEPEKPEESETPTTPDTGILTTFLNNHGGPGFNAKAFNNFLESAFTLILLALASLLIARRKQLI